MWSWLTGLFSSSWTNICLCGIIALVAGIFWWHYTGIIEDKANLELEVKLKEQAINELEKTIKNKEKLMEFQKANDKEFIENSKSVDDNLSFIQKQIELVPVIETKERVLDEKSSFIVNF